MSFVQQKKVTFFDVINYSLLAIISLVCIIPFLYTISISLTSQEVYVPFRFYLIPEKFSLEAYQYILSTSTFINALKSTAFVTVVGTVMNLIFTFTAAYGLTKKDFPHRGLFLAIIVFTLIFSAGIIPTYMLIQATGLLNSYWSLILPALTNSWNLIVVKSFMDSIPAELEEAALIDGCNDLVVFVKIIIPLSMASIAAFTLFFAVGYWNIYFEPLLYISDTQKRTLQVLVKSLVLDVNSQLAGSNPSYTDEIVVPSEVLRMAAVVFAMAPILVIYPFLQKYFVKGVMLGSIKG